MLIPKAYVVTFAGVLAVLATINFLPVPAYQSNPALTACRGRDLQLDAKLAQAAKETRYDLMTFGNSRIVAIGLRELGMPGIRFFSMAVGGTSFRQSTGVLEMLADIGKAPKVAVLSYDHPALVYAQLPYQWPLPPSRWKMVAGDLSGLVFGPYVVGPDWRKFRKRVLIDEVGYVARLFNLNLLLDRAQVLLGMPPSDTAACSNWEYDGSRPNSKEPTSDLDGKKPEAWPVYEDRYPLLEHDLDRLAAIQGRGTTIVIYESPLFPDLLPAFASLPQEMADQRRRLFDGCRDRGLDCRPSPEIHGSERHGFWPDMSHAPPRALGRWIAEIVTPYLHGEEGAR